MTWTCPTCTFDNISNSGMFCEICHSERHVESVSCSKCTFFNPADRLNCEMCGADIQAEIPFTKSSKKRKYSDDRQAQDDALQILSIKTLPKSCNNNFIDSNGDRSLKWEGYVEMTACPGSPSSLTISRVLETKDLMYAAFSGYCIDNEWLMSLIPTNLPWTIFSHRPKDMDPATHVIDIAPGKKLVYPKMSGAFGCMHIKFLILFYPDRCRFVLPSANIVEYDWSKIENIVYYQDFPVSNSKGHCKFQNDLIKTLELMLSPVELLSRIRKYDFEKALGALILSKPGSFLQSDSQKFGKEALATVVKDLSIPSTELSFSYCQSSSLGSLSKKWLGEFQSCIHGADYSETIPQAEIKIVFPSEKTVKNSLLGPANGGTIFAQRKQWIKPDFPRKAVADCNSTSSKALMHSKIIIHSNCKPKGEYLEFTSCEDSAKEGYLYLGSHNHTQAAWGKYQMRKPILKISNWELGVVIPIKYASAGFKIPFMIPPAEYSESDSPWFNQIDFGSINQLKGSTKK